MTTDRAAAGCPRPSTGRRLAAWLASPCPRSGSGCSWPAPVGWLVVAYLGSLVVLFLNAFWSRDPFTCLVVREFTLDNFVEMLDEPALPDGDPADRRRWPSWSPLTCVVLAFPIAYYMAQGRLAAGSAASSPWRSLMPLWASYLVKAYTWRLILSEDGVLNWVLAPLGLRGPGFGERRGSVARLHLPLAAVHDPADLRRPRADPDVPPRGVVRSRAAEAGRRSAG